MTETFFMPKFDFSGRDIACFLFAAGVHSLLFLWQGGAFTMNQGGGNLGDTLVQVSFMSDVPYSEPAGGGSERPKGFMARMKSLIKGEGAPKSELAQGQEAPAPQVETPKSAWSKTDALSNKAFVDKKGFEGIASKDALAIAKGETQQVLVKPSQGNFKTAEPNLKENAFKLARKDVPFKIATAKNTDALANVNAIPVVVGRTTSASVKSLDGGPGAGPAFQSKTFAPSGTAGASGFGGGGSKSAGSGGGLAMGQASAGLASGPAGNGGGGSGYGSGSGTGQGTGSGNGFGSGKGSGGGRTWGSGNGMGTGSALTALPRNTVTADDRPAGTKHTNNSGFNITGPLADRPILQKTLARYEIDGRVALRFRVDWSGKVLDGILVEISSGSPTFDQKVIASLKEWMFSRLPGNRSNEIQEGVITFVFKGV